MDHARRCRCPAAQSWSGELPSHGRGPRAGAAALAWAPLALSPAPAHAHAPPSAPPPARQTAVWPSPTWSTPWSNPSSRRSSPPSSAACRSTCAFRGPRGPPSAAEARAGSRRRRPPARATPPPPPGRGLPPRPPLHAPSPPPQDMYFVINSSKFMYGTALNAVIVFLLVLGGRRPRGFLACLPACPWGTGLTGAHGSGDRGLRLPVLGARGPSAVP
jgi:hypothetical protein